MLTGIDTGSAMAAFERAQGPIGMTAELSFPSDGALTRVVVITTRDVFFVD